MPESRRRPARERTPWVPPPLYRGRLLAAFVVTFIAMSYGVAGFSFATYVPTTAHEWSLGAMSAMFIISSTHGRSLTTSKDGTFYVRAVRADL